MCCCKPQDTISIEVWPHLVDDDNFTSVIREAIRQAEIKFGEGFSAEVQYVESRYLSDIGGDTHLVHRFTATSPGIR